MKPNPSSGDERNGFTLIEIMVVVLLIGIMTVMILPEMKGTYQDALLRSTSRDLINACQLAYSRAVSFNQPHRLRLNTARGTYAIEKRVFIEQQESFVPLRDVPGGEGALDSRIKIVFQLPGELPAADSEAPTLPGAPAGAEAPGREIVVNFHPDGTADAGDLVLQDAEGFRLALRINPTTARVRVVRMESEGNVAGGTGGVQ